jgi:hypothetical protein
MTPKGPEPSCALCGGPATQTIEPPRRTLARGVDPVDTSYSVTVLLPNMALCAEHAFDVRQGERLIGWCDEPPCRTYGEVGEPSSCGNPYEKLGPGRRP